MTARAALLATALLFLAPAAAAQAPAPPRPGPVFVSFHNDLPSTFRLDRVRFYVDGAEQHDGDGTFNEWLPAGAREVEVIADYTMSDRVFSYMRGYNVELVSKHAIRPANGRVTLVTAIAAERGDATTPITRRAQIAWRDAVR